MKIIIAYESEDCHSDTGYNVLVWPDSAMIRSRKPLFLPDCEMRLLLGFVAKIDAVGKSIRNKFASRYYKEIAPAAFILTSEVAKEIENLKNPLACDIVADYSIICGDFVPADGLTNVCSNTEISLEIFCLDSGETITKKIFDSDNIIENINKAVVTASERNTLKTGDFVGFVKNLSFDVRPESIIKLSVNGNQLIENKFK